MKQVQHRLAVRTSGQGLYEVTREITAWVAETGIADALLTVFCRGAWLWEHGRASTCSNTARTPTRGNWRCI
jgi:hypothetical protein